MNFVYTKEVDFGGTMFAQGNDARFEVRVQKAIDVPKEDLGTLLKVEKKVTPLIDKAIESLLETESKTFGATLKSALRDLETSYQKRLRALIEDHTSRGELDELPDAIERYRQQTVDTASAAIRAAVQSFDSQLQRKVKALWAGGLEKKVAKVAGITSFKSAVTNVVKAPVLKFKLDTHTQTVLSTVERLSKLRSAATQEAADDKKLRDKLPEGATTFLAKGNSKLIAKFRAYAGKELSTENLDALLDLQKVKKGADAVAFARKYIEADDINIPSTASKEIKALLKTHGQPSSDRQLFPKAMQALAGQKDAEAKAVAVVRLHCEREMLKLVGSGSSVHIELLRNLEDTYSRFRHAVKAKD